MSTPAARNDSISLEFSEKIKGNLLPCPGLLQTEPNIFHKNLFVNIRARRDCSVNFAVSHQKSKVPFLDIQEFVSSNIFKSISSDYVKKFRAGDEKTYVIVYINSESPCFIDNMRPTADLKIEISASEPFVFNFVRYVRGYKYSPSSTYWTPYNPSKPKAKTLGLDNESTKIAVDGLETLKSNRRAFEALLEVARNESEHLGNSFGDRNNMGPQ